VARVGGPRSRWPGSTPSPTSGHAPELAFIRYHVDGDDIGRRARRARPEGLGQHGDDLRTPDRVAEHRLVRGPPVTDSIAASGDSLYCANAPASIGSAPAGSARTAGVICRNSSGTHDTASSGAGVPTTPTDATRLGWRAARLRATRPPADHPTTGAGPIPRLFRVWATSSAIPSNVGTVPSGGGEDWP
jgi:hypothetical protein